MLDPLNGKDALKGKELLKALGKVIHFGEYCYHNRVNPSNAETIFRPKHKNAMTFENHLNPVMCVLI